MIEVAARAATADRPVALVTGAGGAIGTAIARRLAAEGHGLVLTDIAAEPLAALASELSDAAAGGLLAVATDLSNPPAIAALADAAQARGRIDFLVNNAGLNRPVALETVTLADWEAVFAINLRAPMLLAKALIANWRRLGGGAIVNIGSRVWVSGAAPAYTASKAGLVGLTRSFAVELGPIGVTANVVAPSFIDTPFTRQNRSAAEIAAMHERALAISPIPRLGEADDIAGAVAFFLSDAARFVTGEVLHVCGGAQLAARPTRPMS